MADAGKSQIPRTVKMMVKFVVTVLLATMAAMGGMAAAPGAIGGTGVRA